MDELREQEREPSSSRGWLNRYLRKAFVARDPKWRYAVFAFIYYIEFVVIYLLCVVALQGDIWHAIDKASAVGTCLFGIAVGGIEWIREGSNIAIGIAALLTALFFVVVLWEVHDVLWHLGLLFLFSLVVAVFDFLRYCEVLENAESPQMTRRRLVLFGVDLPLCIGLFTLIMFWLLIEVLGARVSSGTIEVFLTGGLALELALTSATTTFLIVFAKDAPQPT